MTTDLPLRALSEGSETERRLAARTIREAAAEQPLRLQGSLARLVDALGDEQESVRRDVANALFEVGVAEPTAIAPVVDPLVGALDDEVTAVRACVARPLAELAAERPRRVRFAVPALIAPLSDVKSVRSNVAWALSSLAPSYPELLEPHADELTRALLDEHYPVQVSVLRTLRPLERAYPGLCDVVSDRLRELVTAAVASVRQAACRLAAVTDQSWVDEALRERARADSHPLVRERARAARAAAATHTDPTVPDSAFESATLGTWVAVRTDAVGVDSGDGGDTTDAQSDRHGTPFLVGKTTSVVRDYTATDEAAMASHSVRREDFETRQEWLAAPRFPPSGDRAVVHLHNPAADYGITLHRATDGIEATHVDGEDCHDYRVEDLLALEPGRARLLAATPGDRLAFELEGATHDVRVGTAGYRNGRYRVTGENEHQGYRITFRPFGTEPMMAVFEEGRAFRARNVSLTVDE
ncbi:hypothetical protein SAMN05216388_100470 [Halorientalis persicus]|uniref:HEAT repeat-containing protein n=1 Tax=Halorientalis persicus TaxID=1367881 RepID=A0A1H8I503_9EURY|nr:hypothetical protein [Halorientalis persicus]SEN63361.1 hypothetical protein SAMN05216388_100470 [Halorientalis persicus]